MSPFKRNLTRVVIFTTIVLFGAAISSGIYYLKIKKNESIQNQLQFRELRLATNSIDLSLVKLQQIATFFESNMTCNLRFADEEAAININWLSACKARLQTRINQSKELQNIDISSIAETPSRLISNSTKQIDLPSKTKNNEPAPQIVLSEYGDIIVVTQIKGSKTIDSDDPSVLSMPSQIPLHVSLTLNIKDLIPELNLFSSAMVVNKRGEIMARKDYVSSDASTVDISINSLNQYVSIDADTVQVSNMQDITIAGVDYRLYVHPISDNHAWKSAKDYLIVGMVPLSTINIKKLTVSPIVIMWAVLIMLLLVAFTPLLKLRFINSKYAFSSSDISQLVIGLVVCAGILTIASSQQMFFQYFIDNKIEQGKLIHKSIRQDFADEVNSLLDLVESKRFDSEAGKLQNLDEAYRYNNYNSYILAVTKAVINKNRESGSVGSKTDQAFYNYRNPLLSFVDDKPNPNAYVVEQMGAISSKGSFVKGSTVHSINPNLFINGDIDITGREYFKRAMACDTWVFAAHQAVSNKADNSPDCRESLYLQRINNLEDGRKTTMLALPMFDSADKTALEQREIFIFNTKLNTFMERVLPMNFGYAVFNENGDVLYHNNDEASLIENIFIETDQNKQFITAVAQQKDANNPIPLQLKYAGADHIFISAPLVSKISDNSLPWHLVVYYNEGDVAMNNMLLVFLAVLLFFVVVMPIFLLLRFLTHQKLWNELLYYNDKKAAGYRKWAWFIGSVSIACILSISMVDDLVDRLIVWLFAGLLVVRLLRHNHKVDLKAYSRSRYPEFSILIVIGFYLLISIALKKIDLPIISENFAASLIGLICLGLGACMISRRAKTMLSRNFGIVFSAPPDEGKVRRRKHADNERYNMGFVGYLLSLVLIAGAVPGVLIANSTHGYLLQRQAQMQSYAMNDAVKHHNDVNAAYLTNFGLHNALVKQLRTSWGNLTDWQAIFPKKLILHTADAESQAWISVGGLPNLIYDDEGFLPSLNKRLNNNQENLSDDLIDHIFSGMQIQDSLGTKLTFMALEETTSEYSQGAAFVSKNSLFPLMFRPDSYMLAASRQSWATIIILCAAIFFFLFKTIQFLVVKRLLGEHVAEHFRVVRPCDSYSKEEKRWPLLRQLSAIAKNTHPHKGKRILLLNANVQSTKVLCQDLDIQLHENKVFHISDCVEFNAAINIFENSIRLALQQHAVLNIAINGLDEISNYGVTRKLAVKVLSRLSAIEEINVILVADTAPIYRLLRQQAYKIDYAETPHTCSESDSFVDIDEKLSWSKLFSVYEKEYIWAPQQKALLSDPLDIAEIVDFESIGWAELAALKNTFYDYHRRIKSPDGSITDLHDYWLPEQVIEFFLVQAGAIYRKQWELCTVHEKVALWQLASGAKINPTNLEIIDHLTRRGFIYRDKGWHIINESFRRFILSAESSRIIAQWMETTKSGLWPIIRIPLFTLLLVLIVLVIYSSGFALNSVLGIATTTLGIVPLLLKNLTLIKGSSAGLGD